MSKKKSSRSSGIVGFFVALLLLGFVIFAGQTDYLGPISADLRAEFSALYTRSTVDYELTAAKLLAAVGVLCLIYLVCRILRLLLKLFSRSARTRTVNELVGSIITYLAVILGIVWALTILGLDPTAAFASLGIVTRRANTTWGTSSSWTTFAVRSNASAFGPPRWWIWAATTRW